MKLFLILILAIPQFAFAKDEVVEQKEPVEVIENNFNLPEMIFESEKNVRYLLQSEGIKPTQLNWKQIAMMCSNLQSFSDRDQNKCKYNKAKQLYLYGEEKSFCKKFVETSYSYNRLSQSEARTYLMIDASGTKSNVTLIENGAGKGNSK